ncbi:MAG: tetratricopeptide repeat protein [Treponema sp.]|nr:tetratricopeptide repeat protein [Treponema sp.]
MPESSVVFLPVPEFLKSEFKAFTLDPAIPLPVEFETSADTDEKSFDLSTLSWEMILSGVLRVIAAKGKSDFLADEVFFNAGDLAGEREMTKTPQAWTDYYRNFVFAVKPEIFSELTIAAIAKSENGDYDMALEISSILEGLFPRSPGVLLNKALILEKKAEALEHGSGSGGEHSQRALQAYETALSTEPVLPDTLFNSGFFFMRQRDFARAKHCFSQYVALADKTEINEEKAREAGKMIADIGEHHLEDAAYWEAYDCIRNGNDEMGLLKIREFIEKHPKVWNGWFVLGWALRKLARYADGIEAFRKTQALGGDNSDTRNEIAICLMESGDHKAAQRELEKALQEDPVNVKIICNLGVLAMKAGDKDKAIGFFKTALEFDGEDPLARHFLSQLEGSADL